MNLIEINFAIQKYSAFVRKSYLPLHQIVVDDAPERDAYGQKSLDIRRAETLYRCFESNGCQRNDNPIIVRALDDEFICLDGRHRIIAAKRFLQADDQSWPALIFCSGSLSRAVVIREELTKAPASDILLLRYLSTSGWMLEPDSDGDIYRVMRFYESCGDVGKAELWKRKLTGGKQKCIAYLNNTVLSQERTLASRLDQLLPFIGLWTNFKLGTHRLEGSGCPEELACYLDRVYQTWSMICGAQPELATLVTVQKLENLYPQHSSHDANRIADMFQCLDVFETALDVHVRCELQSRCLDHRGRILSLGSFLADSKFLTSTAEAMKLLVPKSGRKSFKDALYVQYRGRDGTFERAYRSLWLYTWQKFPEIVAVKIPRNRRVQVRAMTAPLKVAEFVAFSRQLGFDIPLENAARSQGAFSSNASAIKAFLKSLSIGQNYKSNDITAAVQAIEPILTKFLQSIQPQAQHSPTLSLNGSQLRDDERYGMPHATSFEENRVSLCFHWIYQQHGHAAVQMYVSSFAILRDQFHSFFGNGEDDNNAHADIGIFVPSSSSCDDDIDEQYWEAQSTLS